MPTLIVEDGTGVANANSYIDLAYLESYATDRGLTIPSTDETKEQYILKGMDYLFWFTEQWQGSKTASANALPWPRQDVMLECVEFADDEIPTQLKNALAQLVVEQQARTRLFPKPRTSSVEGLVIQKTAGPITKKFAFNGTGTANSEAPIKIMSVEVFLKSLYSTPNRKMNTVRV